jgi:hypothetical protein
LIKKERPHPLLFVGNRRLVIFPPFNNLRAVSEVELPMAVKDTTMCGLGQTAPNPVLSTLRYFRDEYEAHVKYKRCPAVVCKKIVSSPCYHTCPIGLEACVYIALIARGEFEKAVEIIRTDARKLM